jgi:YesN/AraC family two-component response regulator
MSGSYSYAQSEDPVITISAGEFMLVSPGVSHVIKPLELDSETFAVAFEPMGEDGAQPLKLMSALRSMSHINGTLTDMTAQLIEMIMDEAHNGYLLGIQNIKSMMLLLVIDLVRNAFPNDILVDKDSFVGEDDRMREIKQFLLDNQDKTFSVEDLARNMNISTKYLGNIIHSSTGLSAKQFIDKLKSEKAKKLLLDTDLSIYEISYKLGFDDCNNFNRFFKRVEGMPPGVFRNAKGKKVR